MSPAFRARRRAEEFHRQVEARASARGATAPTREDATPNAEATELARLADLAAGLRELPVIEPRAEFAHALRERLMAAAEAELAPARERHGAAVEDRLTVGHLTDPTKRGRRQRRLTVAVVALAVVAGTAGTAVASQNALPGDILYPVKRVVENVRTGLSVDDHAKGADLLGDARTRLSEVEKLAAGRPEDAAELRSTLETFASQAARASDLLLEDYRKNRRAGSIKDLRDFTSTGIDRLAALEAAGIPEQAKAELTDAAQTLVLIDQAAQAACPDCGGTGLTDLPSSLLGSLSVSLDSLPPALLPHSDTAPQASDQQTPHPQHSPSIALPSVNPSSLQPGSVTGGNPGPKNGSPQSDDSTGDQSTDQSDDTNDKGDQSNQSGTKDGSGGTGSGSGDTGPGGTTAPGDHPTSVGDALGDTVTGVVGGVGGLLGGVVGGLLGGGN